MIEQGGVIFGQLVQHHGAAGGIRKDACYALAPRICRSHCHLHRLQREPQALQQRTLRDALGQLHLYIDICAMIVRLANDLVDGNVPGR
jgi:hypothetical protein